MKQKYYVELNRQEWRLIIEGLYPDAVDEVLIKVAKAKPQKLGLRGWRY